MTYPGGKGKCYQRLINLMPPHRVFIETHLGGGAVLRNKRPARASIGVDIDPQVIKGWRAEDPDLAKFVCADAASFLNSLKFTGDELIYADPPYMPSTRRKKRVYRYEYDEHQHRELLKTLTKLDCMVVISGYDSELYNGLLKGWNKAQFSAQSQSGPRKESVWMNYEMPKVLHDGSFIGFTFREREQVKRRRERLLRRVDQLDQLERNELVRRLAQRYGDELGVRLCR